MSSASYTFPSDFLWGVATAAYQIEGAANEDGRKDCVWDTFARRGGVRTGEGGLVACDHYHRYLEDVQLMAKLGVKHYRLSVSWPRVMPDGTGAVNEAGIGFYERLIDCLLAHGITPHVTLFHWDTPQALEDRYLGWRDRQISDHFADYVSVVVKRLGDRVTNWFTLNEVGCFTALSYGPDKPMLSAHAPGVHTTAKEMHQTILHAMLAHGKGCQAIRAASPRRCSVALVDNCCVDIPLIEDAAHIAAAARRFQLMWVNGAVTWPALQGRFAPDWQAWAEANGSMPEVRAGDMEIIKQPLDRLGINVYTGGYVRPAANELGYECLPLPEHYPKANIPWLAMTPESIYWVPRLLKEAVGYTGDIVITENGCAATDTMTPDGEIHDTDRIMYLRQYLRQVHRAIAEGYPISGYFHWSFMDNFEWSWGYAKRFGLVFNEYSTQRRIPKDSYHWYREAIRQNRVV
jgi:beta-glucosidase